MGYKSEATMNKKIEQIKKIVKNGGTIEDAAKLFNVVPRTINNWLKASYKNEKCYHNLLDIARKNKLARKRLEKKKAEESANKEAEENARKEAEEKEEVLSERRALEKAFSQAKNDISHQIQEIRNDVRKLRLEEEQKVVVVCETGYLLQAGYEGIWGIEAQIYLPAFCYAEIDRQIEAKNQTMIEVSYLDASFKIMKPFKLAKERLNKFAITRKRRSSGVVAVCCELARRGKNVVLLTHSEEISRFADFQECGIIVKKI